jgi:uncharacterized lipoprotein
MSSSPSFLRIAVLAALIIAVAGASGCRWFRKTDPYAQDVADRPLELPPLLDTASVEAASVNTASGSVTRSSLGGGGTQAARSLGFNVSTDRAATFERVGQALAGIEGLTIASRAQLLGAYDVDYRGAKFLVRIADSGSGSVVSAVDPRGQPAQGEAPAALIAALKTAVDGR